MQQKNCTLSFSGVEKLKTALLQLLSKVWQEMEVCNFWAGQRGPSPPFPIVTHKLQNFNFELFRYIEKLKIALLQLLGKAGQEMELLQLWAWQGRA